MVLMTRLAEKLKALGGDNQSYSVGGDDLALGIVIKLHGCHGIFLFNAYLSQIFCVSEI